MNQENNVNLSVREKILSAGRSLMAEKGIKETTLADIARSAGISKGTLFYYYASKNDLIYDTLDQHITSIANFSKEHLPKGAGNLDPSETLRIRLEQLTSDPDINRLNFYLLQEGFTGNGIINAKFAERYHNWRKSIAEDTAKVFDISDQQVLATLGTIILAVIDGLTLQKLIEPDSVNMDQVASQLASMINAQKKWETLRGLFSDMVTHP